MKYDNIDSVIEHLESGDCKNFEEIEKATGVNRSTVSSIFSKEKRSNSIKDKVFNPKYSNNGAPIAVAFEDFLNDVVSEEVEGYSKRKKNQYENSKNWFRNRWKDDR